LDLKDIKTYLFNSLNFELALKSIFLGSKKCSELLYEQVRLLETLELSEKFIDQLTLIFEPEDSYAREMNKKVIGQYA
jgi:hypothetical protein